MASGNRRRSGRDFWLDVATVCTAACSSVPSLADGAKGQRMAGGDELLLQDRAWRRRNSMWLLPTLACCGVLTWASFLYIGVKAKRPSWLAAAAFYGVAFILYFVLVGTSPKAADGSTSTSRLAEHRRDRLSFSRSGLGESSTP